MDRRYVPRFADYLLDDLTTGLPALFITGPRAAGKTTTAARHAASVVRLDRQNEAQVFLADPDLALRQLPEPILLDEWQAVPDVLGAVKRAVDTDPRPGRFIVAGSVRADMTAGTWPGTGRLVRVPMWGLAVREMHGAAHDDGLLQKLARDGVDAVSWPPDPPDLRGYMDLALLGGFPEPALHLPPARRMRWHDSYRHQVMTRDTDLVDTDRDPERLRRYFDALTACTACIVG